MRKVLNILSSVLISGMLLFSCMSPKEERVEIEDKNFHEYHDDLEMTQMEINGVNVLSNSVMVENYISDEMLVDGELDDEEVIIYPDRVNEKDVFKVSEFIQYDPQPSPETLYKIKTIHIPELIKVRTVIGEPIIIRSGARSYEWEKKEGAVVIVNTSTQTEMEQ